MSRYALRVDVVRGSIDRLIKQRIHQHTMGYLAVRYMMREKPVMLPRTVSRPAESAEAGGASAGGSGRPAVRNADIVEFFREFVAVPGYDSRPFYRPFTDAQQPALAQGWMNKNVSGSYAPNSQRATGFGAVVERAGGTAGRPLLAFRDGYAQVVRKQFAYERPLPAFDIAVYLYRNHAFEAEAPPDGAALLAVFRRDFGYDDEPGASEFAALFSDQVSTELINDPSLFEDAPPAARG